MASDSVGAKEDPRAIRRVKLSQVARGSQNLTPNDKELANLIYGTGKVNT